uniref:Uncharacterized protein n=1 Tax=Utricularia reniformis TaxID=192314 RepID=A0A1Y0B3E1_9LAMI|nr:hypothetical protein AEK19_MT1768 [Utricularia reniformis]ART31942.1 hypothetical protein AEK19_MT1768 [Utricularia reniformis]
MSRPVKAARPKCERIDGNALSTMCSKWLQDEWLLQQANKALEASQD